jgi:OOP family OmpA-OmpF porin
MPTNCSQCGAELAEGNAFCRKCGARQNAVSESAATARFCARCGAPLAGTKFCAKCGASASATPLEPTTPANSPASDPSSPTAASLGDHATPERQTVDTAVASTVVPLPVKRLPASLIGAGVGFLLIVAMIAVGVVYVVHRAERKAEQIRTAYDIEKDVAALKTAESNEARQSRSPGTRSSNSSTAEGSSSRPAAPYGWTLVNGKLVPAPPPTTFVPATPPSPLAPIVPAAATGNAQHDWALKYERTENSPEADLVVRTGDINNLGFGWPEGFDPFSGQSTPQHPYPWRPRPDEPDGTDRIMIGSALDPPADYPKHFLTLNDGYSGILKVCEGLQPPPGQICKQRAESMPQAIRLAVGSLPPKINTVLFQMFVDDFQAAIFGSHFQVSLNKTRIPSFEYAINSLNQTGPIGKLVSLKLLPEYWPLLKSGEVKLLIDDPTTKQGDGYAVDFVRILVNPHRFKYEVSLNASVIDADKRSPIPNALVTAALDSATTDGAGKCQFKNLPAGLVIATASAPGYDENSVPVDLPAGQVGTAEISLHRHQETTAALEKSIEQTGSAAIYGIHFDTDSAKLRADSLPALNAVLALINNHPGSRWIISGHTDNQGSAAHNQPLSERRAAAVIAWLGAHGVEKNRLVSEGFGATRPVADNSTPAGRALNRRVEVALAK